jgi:hypothetical protein
MLSQETYDQLIRDGGCVFEFSNKVCRKAVQPGKKHCPMHEAMLAEQQRRISVAATPKPAHRRVA